jgi:hypothetical protein
LGDVANHYFIISLPYRILGGAVILLWLAVRDLKQHGRSATRWREYLFLIFCVAVAIGYGIFNDLITSRISWEYFYYGKELAPILGPEIPPNSVALDHAAMRIGAMATWWAGLVIGAGLLIANNPSRRYPQLTFHRLAIRLIGFILITLICALLLGFVGHEYWLNWISEDFRDISDMNLWRPRRFMTTYGIHLGGYLGGAIGMIYGIISIRRERRLLPKLI